MRTVFVLFVVVFAAVICAEGAVGTAVPVTEPSGLGPAFGRYAEVATNGRGYLAVWTDGSARASRLDAAGAPLDVRPLLLPDIGDRYVVASDGAGYLVAGWSFYADRVTVYFVAADTGAVTKAFSDSGGFQPQLVRTTSAYVLSYFSGSSAAFVTLDSKGMQRGATSRVKATNFESFSIVANGDDVALFRRDKNGVTRALLLSKEGGVYSLPDGTIAAGDTALAGVASDGDRYLTVDRKGDAVTARVYARNLEPIGELTLGNMIYTGFPNRLVVSARQRGFFVFRGGSKGEATVTLINENANGEGPYALMYNAVVDAAVSIGERTLLLYSGSGGFYVRSLVATVPPFLPFASTDGTVVSLEPMRAARASIAADDAGSFAIAWQGAAFAGGEILVRTFGADGTPLAPQFSLGAGHDPVIVSDGEGGYLCAWIRDIAPGSVYAPIYANIAPSGGIRNGTIDSAERSAPSIAAVWARDHFVIAWRREMDKRNTVAMRIARNGDMLDRQPLDITAGARRDATASYSESSPLLAVTSAGIYFAIPTQITDGYSATVQVFGGLFSYDLDTMRPFERIATDAFEPQLSRRDGELLLTFHGLGGSGRSVRLGDDGTPFDDTIGRVLAAPFGSRSLGWLGDRWAFAAPQRLSYVGADGLLLGDESPGLYQIDSIAPAASGNYWYAGACSNGVQICLGTLVPAPPRTRRRAAH